MDGGFAYAIPERLDVKIGSLVRVPLGGRVVDGFVVGIELGEDSGLRQIKTIRGAGPVFTLALASVLRWAAAYYVAPLAVLLSRAAPPNLPGAELIAEVTSHPRPARVLLANPNRDPWWELVVEDGGGLVVVATETEANRYEVPLRRMLGDRLVTAVADRGDRALTDAWNRAASVGGTVLLGTPRTSLWPIAGLTTLVAVEEGRRAMKDRQTPTLAVREILRRRSQLEGGSAVFVGPTPSLEAIAMGAQTVKAGSGNRVWPLVEVVERNGEMSGLFTITALAALKAVAASGGRAFVYCHRRGYAPAVRCVRCHTVRRCPVCGSRPDRGTNCPRCGAELGSCVQCGSNRFEALGAGIGRVAEEIRKRLGEVVAQPPATGQILVGSEADLAAAESVDLAVAVDADGLILGPTYRSAEDALRILARLACLVKAGSGHRLLVQTSLPDHPVITALKNGHPLNFLQAELASREKLGYPPAGELLIIEVRNADPPRDELTAALSGNEVLGPAESARGLRWLVQGTDLTAAKQRLRPVIQRWRDGGATVRIDVDPIDL